MNNTIMKIALTSLVTSTSLAAVESCLSTREYVTTFNYLSKKKDFALSHKQKVKIADKVSSACSGAANNFIKVVDILSRADVSTSDAIKTALLFTESDSEVVEAFRELFKKSFQANYLNLDLRSSINIAKKLSVDFNGTQRHALFDFRNMVKFCVSKNNLDLPRPQCAVFAKDVALLGEKFDASISDSFIKNYNFLKSTKGPYLTNFKALELAKKVSTYGPKASDNFIQGYKFATSKKGLSLVEKKAMEFAMTMAKRTVKKKSE